MASKLLFDTRNNNIMRCQAEPNGSASLPSFEGLCRSARIPEDEKQYMDTVMVDEDYLTNQAQKELRIVNNEVIPKRKIALSVNKKIVDTSISNQFKIIVDIEDIIAADDISFVTIYFEDAQIDISITDKHGEQVIDISETGAYIISYQGDLFRNHPQVQVEVI
jgi:hypothetical protein